VGPGPFDPGATGPAELVVLLLGTLTVGLLVIVGEVAWRRLRGRFSRRRRD
jgi:hypothetical protein